MNYKQFLNYLTTNFNLKLLHPIPKRLDFKIHHIYYLYFSVEDSRLRKEGKLQFIIKIEKLEQPSDTYFVTLSYRNPSMFKSITLEMYDFTYEGKLSGLYPQIIDTINRKFSELKIITLRDFFSSLITIGLSIKLIQSIRKKSDYGTTAMLGLYLVNKIIK